MVLFNSIVGGPFFKAQHPRSGCGNLTDGFGLVCPAAQMRSLGSYGPLGKLVFRSLLSLAHWSAAGIAAD